jgi:Uma2 family endonuclease
MEKLSKWRRSDENMRRWLIELINYLAAFFRKPLLSVQNPIELGAFSQPEPDIALLRWQDDFYESGHPQAQDVYLLIEVADTTLETDRAIKLPIYAQTGISEVWIVNLQDLQVEVYRSPIEDTYSVSQILTAGQMLTISGLPDVAIEFNEILS